MAHIKYSSEGETVVLDLFKKGRRVSDVPNIANIELSHLDPVEIDSDKYKDLSKMCDLKIIPEAHHDYYKNIGHYK